MVSLSARRLSQRRRVCFIEPSFCCQTPVIDSRDRHGEQKRGRPMKSRVSQKALALAALAITAAIAFTPARPAFADHGVDSSRSLAAR